MISFDNAPVFAVDGFLLILNDNVKMSVMQNLDLNCLIESGVVILVRVRCWGTHKPTWHF